jgi:putative transposase
LARLPRIDVPNLPQHIIQRGNNRAACFFHDADYHFYLDVLKDAAQKYHCRIHAYVLMTNHVHLLLTGAQAGSTSLLMQSLGRSYVRYVNSTYRRTGTLWEGRFKSSIIESEGYLLTCYRYVELNPVRAGLVRDPGAYAWSSYAHNALGHQDALIQDHQVYMALGSTVKTRCQAYQDLVAEGVGEGDLQAIRDHVNKGRVLGSASFQEEIEAMLKRRVKIQPPGRPRKKGGLGT